MRKLLLVCVVVFFLFLASCSFGKNEEEIAPTYEYQVDLSEFVDIWRASPLPNGINLGSTWTTSAFSVEFSEVEHGIHINFVVEDYTIADCFENGCVLISAIAHGDEEDTFLFDTELFYMMALLEHVDEYSAAATITKPSNANEIMVIVIVDGIVYNEMIFLN